MARLLRRDLGLFCRLDLISVIVGGYCGYVIGDSFAKSKVRELMKNDRMVERVREKVNEAKRESELGVEKKKEIMRSYRAMKTMTERFEEKERALRKLEQQLKDRTRKVESAEKTLVIKESVDLEKYAHKSGYARKENSSCQDFNLEGASNELKDEKTETIE